MKLLLVHDDPEIAALVEEAAPPGVELVACLSSREAVELLQAGAGREIDLTLVDLTERPHLAPSGMPESRHDRRLTVMSAHWKAREEAPRLIRFSRRPFDPGPLVSFFREHVRPR